MEHGLTIEGGGDPDEQEEIVEDAAQEVSEEDEVDVTLIRWMLSLSPLERLRTAQRYAGSAQRLRNAPVRRPADEKLASVDAALLRQKVERHCQNNDDND